MDGVGAVVQQQQQQQHGGGLWWMEYEYVCSAVNGLLHMTCQVA